MHGILYMTSRWLYMKTIAVPRTVAMGIYQRNAFIMKYGKKYKCYISFSILSRLYIAILPQWFLFSTWEQFKHGKAILYMSNRITNECVTVSTHVYPYLHFDHCCTIVVVGRIGESEVVRRTNGVTWLQRLCRRKVRCILP